MKRLVYAALALALGLGPVLAQNITRSIQGNSNDSRGPIGWDTSNAMYFPGHINAFGQQPATTISGCGTTAAISSIPVATDAAGFVGLQGAANATSCSVVFGAPYNQAPNCVVTATGGVVNGTSTPTITTGTTSFQVKNLTAGQSFFYICIGNQ